MRLAILLAMTFFVPPELFGASATDSTPGVGPFKCPIPPVGVIRFAVRSDESTAKIYEWSDKAYRELPSQKMDKAFFLTFKAGSYHEWNFWELANVDRTVAGPGTLLSTPYSTDPVGKILAAGLERKGDDINEPTEFVFLDLSTSRIIRKIEVGRSIVGLSWDPNSAAVVVMSRVERHGKKSLRDKLGTAIGHPISYNDVFLDVFGLDGAVRCSIVPASSVPFGSGLVRWDTE